MVGIPPGGIPPGSGPKSPSGIDRGVTSWAAGVGPTRGPGPDEAPADLEDVRETDPVEAAASLPSSFEAAIKDVAARFGPVTSTGHHAGGGNLEAINVLVKAVLEERFGDVVTSPSMRSALADEIASLVAEDPGLVADIASLISDFSAASSAGE